MTIFHSGPVCVLQVGEELRRSNSSQHLEPEHQVGLFMENTAVKNPVHTIILDKYLTDRLEQSLVYP